MSDIKIQTEAQNGNLGGKTSENQASPTSFQSQGVITNLARKPQNTWSPIQHALGVLKTKQQKKNRGNF